VKTSSLAIGTVKKESGAKISLAEEIGYPDKVAGQVSGVARHKS
jgi:hypothetical protein